MTGLAGWQVEHRAGPAADLHGLGFPDPLTRTVWVLEVTAPAIVLGSAQRDVPEAPPGVDVVRRGSGGGAVWLAPGGTVWVDVLLGRDDPLWRDDVGLSALWLGHTWAAALAAAGVEGAVVHEGRMRRTPWSAAFCFSGLAAGEVTAGEGGPKLVGISQRRTRAGARFQCVAYRRWSAEPLAGSVGVPVDAVSGSGCGTGVEAAALVAAFVACLPG